MRLFNFINIIIKYMVILFILYLNLCYNNNKNILYNNHSFQLSKKIFILSLLYFKTFYELIYNKNNFISSDEINIDDENDNIIIPPIEIEDISEKEVIIDEYILNNEQESINEYIIESPQNKNSLSLEQFEFPIIDMNIVDEEISIDNIHFGSFIDSLGEIEEEKKPVIREKKEIKKIKIGKNKKISTEIIIN